MNASKEIKGGIKHRISAPGTFSSTFVESEMEGKVANQGFQQIIDPSICCASIAGRSFYERCGDTPSLFSGLGLSSNGYLIGIGNREQIPVQVGLLVPAGLNLACIQDHNRTQSHALLRMQ